MNYSIFVLLFSVLLISCKGQDTLSQVNLATQAEQEFETWKQSRLTSLKSPSGWLTITGLIWLKKDELTVGTENQYDATIPHSASANFGTLQRNKDGWDLIPSGDPKLTVKGKPLVEKIKLEDDQSGRTTYVGYESLSWYLIKRGENYGIRVKDSLNQARFDLTSIATFDYNPDYVIDAKVEWASVTDSILITNAQGLVTSNKLKGWLKFEHLGSPHSLSFIDGGGDTWFTVFGDETNSAETYGAGRFLYINVPAGSSTTVLDFNRAQNPPCYHTAFATCPLPPKENQLKTRILAGETSEH